MPYKDQAQQRAYQLARYHRLRAEFFRTKSCLSCGGREDLELDHIDPAEKVSHRIWSWSQSRREAELAKCQVLCTDCHLRKSKEQWWIAHPNNWQNRQRVVA